MSTYAFGVLGVASVAKFIPLRVELEQVVGATPAQYAWLIALLGIPAAFLAAASGAVVDRTGPRLALWVSGAIGAAADLAYVLAPSVRAFQGARLIEGVALVGTFTAGPALLMATTEGRRRILAMTFWSTYTPTGFTLGLLLGGAFAGSPNWRLTFVLHGALLILATLVAVKLPRLAPIPSSASAGERLRDLAGAYRSRPSVQLAMVFFLVISVGFGANTTFPSYLARAHSLSIAAASKLVAGTTLMMIPGAFVVAYLLTRAMRPARVMAALATGAASSGIALFYPTTAPAAIAPLLALWFLCMGGGPALLLSVLPQVALPQHRGAAAGLLNQASAIATFVNPPIWLGVFASGAWLPFAALVGGCWFIGAGLLWFLPSRAGTVSGS